MRQRRPYCEIGTHRFDGALTQRNNPLFPPFSENSRARVVQIDTCYIEAARFTYAQPRTVQKFKNRAIAKRHRRIGVGRLNNFSRRVNG